MALARELKRLGDKLNKLAQRVKDKDSDKLLPPDIKVSISQNLQI